MRTKRILGRIYFAKDELPDQFQSAEKEGHPLADLTGGTFRR